MRIAPKNIVTLAFALLALSVGIVLAANSNWFTTNITYGTNGESAALPSRSYGRAQTADHNDANHAVYSLVSANPIKTGFGPYSIGRRTSAGALDTTFGANGLVTSFANYNNSNYHFHGLCIDPLTHYLVVVGDLNYATTVIERLLPPASNGVAALDTSFNSQGTTPGVVSFNGPLGSAQCSVTGEQSIIVAGQDHSAPNNAVIARVLVGGLLDSSFGTNGVVTFTPPNGQNWEGGGMEWNSSQTIMPDIVIGGDTYPAGNPGANVAALIAVDRCTGVPDTNFNGNGFMSVPAIDNYTFGSPIAGAILSDGHVLAAFVANGGSLNVDLVEWSYPLTASNWQTATFPGTITLPAGLILGGSGANTTPVHQFDGSILISAQTASAQEVLFELTGTANLGFTVGAPAPFNCAGGVTVPNVVGQTQAAATTAVTGAGLTVGTVTQQSSSMVASGSVISESPAAGTRVASGSAVNLVVSTGPAQVAVPNVVGQTQAAATPAITGAGLTVGTVTQQASSTMASGSVISQNPAAGTNVASGSAVNLVVSSGGSGSSGSGSGGGGGGGTFDLYTLATLLGSLILGFRRARHFAPRGAVARQCASRAAGALPD
jgi:hypothetical protein